MMEYAGSDEMDKYRKYIQKRRVNPVQDNSGDENAKTADENGPANSEHHSSESEPYVLWEGLENNSTRYRDSETEKQADFEKAGYSAKAYGGAHNPVLPALHRTDTGLYKKLYSNAGRKQPAYPSPYKSYAGNRAEVEDNRVTLFAVKLIKQALACFAILGIILFMQGRPDMKDALAVVKQQVVDINIQPQSIYEGIVGFINQLSGTAGGSP